jgi:hypothetical protein
MAGVPTLAVLWIAGCTIAPAASPPESASPGSTTGRSASATVGSGSSIGPTVELVPTSDAVVVVSNGHVWTVNKGSSQLADPHVVDSSPTIEAAAITDSGTLLYAASDDGQSIVASISSGTADWKRLETVKLDDVSVGGLSIASAGGSTVVVLVTIQGGSASSIGLSYVHTDAGWKHATAPSGGIITAAAGRYWLVDGVAGDRVFVSVDGLDWQATKLPETASDWTAGSAIGLDSKTVVIPVLSHADGEDSHLTFYESADGGETWATRARTTTPPTEIGTAGAVSITTTGDWVAAFADGSKIRSGDLGGASVRTVSPNGLTTDVSSVAFSTPDFGLAWSTPSDCPNGKTSCTISSVISETHDGGQTWTTLGE